jgi:hypothetical protein
MLASCELQIIQISWTWLNSVINRGENVEQRADKAVILADRQVWIVNMQHWAEIMLFILPNWQLSASLSALER